MTMKLKALDIQPGLRHYEREDGTCWEVCFNQEYKVWSIWQWDPETDEMVFNDPRNGIEDSEEQFAKKLTSALNRIRENC